MRISLRAKPWLQRLLGGSLAVALCALAACGGGEEAESSATANAPSRVNALALATDGEINSQSTSSTAATAAAPAFTYCKTFLAAPTNFGCLQTTTDAAYTTPQNGATLGLGPDFPQCPTINVGSQYMALTPAVYTKINDGNYSCFQFVMTSQATVPVEIKFPPATTGLAEIFIEAPNFISYKQAGVQSPTAPLVMTVTNQNARMFVIVRTSSGVKGLQMGVGVGVPAPTPLANDTYQNAAIVTMGQTVNGTIKTPGVSEAYYFYPQITGQTTQEIGVNFTSNQTATYRLARQTAPGAYTLSTEYTIPASSAGTVIRYTSTNTANAAGATTPYGIMVKVKGVNAAAPANEGFSLRVATLANTIGGMHLTNTDNISRYFPGYSGWLQAATYISPSIGVSDANGNPLPGEVVKIAYKQHADDDNSIVNVYYTTDASGTLVTSFPLSACSGTTVDATFYGPFGSPADRYNGTAQEASVTVSLPNSSVAQEVSLPFLRICTETYLGKYPKK